MDIKKVNETSPNYQIARDKALEIWEKLRLSPPVQAVDVAQHYGLNVRYCEFKEEYNNISGFIEGSTIFINVEESPQRQNFTIAHELGHYLLGHLENPNYDALYRGPITEQNEKYLEQEANCFAANLLVPQDILIQRIHENPLITEWQLSNSFGVSEEVIVFRKKTLQYSLAHSEI
jgi:Zn-dependent peptidase ImmA (M78 family)